MRLDLAVMEYAMRMYLNPYFNSEAEAGDHCGVWTTTIATRKTCNDGRRRLTPARAHLRIWTRGVEVMICRNGTVVLHGHTDESMTITPKQGHHRYILMAQEVISWMRGDREPQKPAATEAASS